MANPLLIAYVVGWVLLIAGLGLLLPLIPAAVYGEPLSWYVKSWVISLCAGSVLVALGLRSRRRSQEMRSRDSLAVVAIAWFLLSLFGALPYWFSGRLDVWGAIFESFSGLSSTGATNINDLSGYPKGLLFWRSLTQYVGGLGIIVLMVAVLPFLGVGGQLLMKNELSSGVSNEKLKPRVAQIAKILWMVYLAFTVGFFLLYYLGGQGVLDSVCLTFTTLSTGGFSNWNDSMGHYSGSYLPVLSIVVMFLGSVSFALHYQLLTGNIRALFGNPEVLFFGGVILASTIVIGLTLFLTGTYQSVYKSFYYAVFHATSIASTTGHALTDWSKWPNLAVGVMFLLFFVGGCSGSTSGGLKCMRWLILIKSIHRNFRRYIHPRGVFPVRINGKPIPEPVLEGVWLFFLLYFVIFAISSVLLTAMGLNVFDSISATASAMGNVGPALGNLGPASTYWWIPGPAKAVLSLDMLLGRLELYSVLIIFVPEFWSK
ncbi:MAG: TrkH family potassium uptake protein [Deltaproteobacteria bacterium]|jgi:trk system potassium uptake protein TrkH|nr:TrkH family potassium uptake protein [Deltaproteobacteria bacterium]